MLTIIQRITVLCAAINFDRFPKSTVVYVQYGDSLDNCKHPSNERARATENADEGEGEGKGEGEGEGEGKCVRSGVRGASISLSAWQFASVPHFIVDKVCVGIRPHR